MQSATHIKATRSATEKAYSKEKIDLFFKWIEREKISILLEEKNVSRLRIKLESFPPLIGSCQNLFSLLMKYEKMHPLTVNGLLTALDRCPSLYYSNFFKACENFLFKVNKDESSHFILPTTIAAGFKEIAILFKNRPKKALAMATLKLLKDHNLKKIIPDLINDISTHYNKNLNKIEKEKVSQLMGAAQSYQQAKEANKVNESVEYLNHVMKYCINAAKLDCLLSNKASEKLIDDVINFFKTLSYSQIEIKLVKRY